MSHMVIRVIVEAYNKEEALDAAKHVLKGLCGEGQDFDYYTTFDEDGSVVSGKARWGALSPVANVNSKEGKKYIADGMKATKDEFIENLKSIREILSCCTDEEIFEEEILDDKTKMTGTLTGSLSDLRRKVNLIRHTMYCCGQYSGPSIWLYNQHGEGLRTQSSLDYCLSHLEEGKGWVVPADVHS